MSKKVSIKDIAEKIGVSNATVSLVLSGKAKSGRVSKEMIKKIKEAAKELNYKPNNLARGLRMGKSQTIGLIVADITNVFFANLAFQIQEYAESLNYTVIITNTNESVEKMEKMINTLKGRQVDGYIIVPTEFGEPVIKDLVATETPVVLIDRYFPDLEVAYVSVNNYYASRKITQYLISAGCKRIALVIYNNTLVHMQDRKRGYTDALAEAGLFDPGLIKKINYQHTQEEVKNAINELIDTDERIDGIFFATNSLSMAGIRQLLKLKVKLSDEVHVACFDKSDAFDFFDVAIPYVHQPIPEMGRKAVDLLINQIEKENYSPSRVELFASIERV